MSRLLNSLISSRMGRGPTSAIATCALVAGIMLGLCAPGARAQQSWSTVGPAGGDARAFAAVPGDADHLYLGTTNSWLYESTDSGASWHRLAKMPGADTLVLDHIVVDSRSPATLYVAAWRTDSAGGGLWISHDAGRTWTESAGLHGQSIFAFAQAPSDPHILFAGTLAGVYRSSDSGATWTEISPAGSHEIHEVESLAIDPANPDIVYAGTWHLPWKTTDGGQSWKNIKQGLIVDSDVFSIILDSKQALDSKQTGPKQTLDPEQTRTVYLSACSGIYKSENAGLLFHKIHGIPDDARRTRVLRQDPENRDVVYAGTTEGLYKTLDAGRHFQRTTDASVIVNDVFVDPRDSKHVLLATDRGGVLASRDGGETFAASNSGISERKVEALLVDHANAERLYAGVVNDKSYGGVFISDDAGKSWRQAGSGLDGRDVYVLSQTADGAVVAGTNAGIFALGAPANVADDSSKDDSSKNGAWEPRNTIANTVTKTVTQTDWHTRVNVEKEVKAPVVELDGRVSSLDVSSDLWAATSGFGLLTSHDKGATWQGGPVMGATDYVSVSVHSDDVAAAHAMGVVLSKDKGQTWWPIAVPKMVTRIHSVAFTPDGTLWMGAREGVYFTHDLGKTWMWVDRLPFRDVDDLSFDAAMGRVLASSRASDQIFAIDPKTLTWKWWQTGYPVAMIRGEGDRLVAASLNNGVLLEPMATGDMQGQRASLPTPGH